MINEYSGLQDVILKLRREGRYIEARGIFESEKNNYLYEKHSFITDSYDDIEYNADDVIRYDYLENDYIETLEKIKSNLKLDFYKMLDITGISNSDICNGDGVYELYTMYNSGQLESLLLTNDIPLYKDKIFQDRNDNVLKSGLEVYIYKIDEEINYRVVKCPECDTYRVNYYVKGMNYEYICPNCKKEYNNTFRRSSGEVLVEKLLKGHKMDFNIEVGVYDKYRFDFVVKYKGVKYFIEVNGKQHYEPVEYFGGIEAFKRQKKVDNIKRKYANDNGVYVELDFREHNIDILKNRFYNDFYNRYIIGGILND